MAGLGSGSQGEHFGHDPNGIDTLLNDLATAEIAWF